MKKEDKKCPRCKRKLTLSLGDDRYVPIHYYCNNCHYNSEDRDIREEYPLGYGQEHEEIMKEILGNED